MPSNDNEKVVLDSNREHELSVLPEDIQKDILALQEKVPDSAIINFVNKTLGLGRGEKIIRLDGLLNNMDESIHSFVALKDPEEQDEAVKNIEIALNPYLNEEEKKLARTKLENLLG